MSKNAEHLVLFNIKSTVFLVKRTGAFFYPVGLKYLKGKSLN